MYRDVIHSAHDEWRRRIRDAPENTIRSDKVRKNLDMDIM